MPDATLADLLDRNDRHVESLQAGYFDDVEDGQSPAVVSMCCSDSRVSQEAMWDVEEPGWLFTPSTIGNQVWDRVDGELVLDGSFCYPMAFTDTEVAVVVGHTGCGAVTAALEAVQGAGDATDEDADSTPAGVAKWVDLLAPVVEDGLDDDRVDPDADASLVDQLVEYNVDRQVAFLQENEDVPDSVDVYGFVYDFQRVYGDAPGRAYLVNANGETDRQVLQSQVDEQYADHVQRLL
ncbi:carbonic anhydrase [Salinarchaeum sp. Harcht-Bsk1]|uniref:carbonic anhydrase n=1 Tax=Salinarchaeum sp. Harcht-Bsk1 TaxID=1333523 RepID=UPI0003423160|nr:carbonic anhydrase [Salinarchaeum sp. Harcht-Bsk1]AGN02415.1 carbonic anhydrase [Salinarchaeum sp. Harcht-Bsk1]